MSAHVLTSGQQSSAEKGLQLITELKAHSGVPIIMAGAGVRASNLELFLNAGVEELSFFSRRLLARCQHTRHAKFRKGIKGLQWVFTHIERAMKCYRHPLCGRHYLAHTRSGTVFKRRGGRASQLCREMDTVAHALSQYRVVYVDGC